MAPAIQAKLLRAIEAREILRVGSVRPIPIDVRFVAATHHDLLALCERGAFRKDLFYRLAGFVLEVPPLRERRDRIAGLAARFLAEAAASSGTAAPALTAAAADRLSSHAWPGNVRELRNVVERARILASGSEVRPEHLFFDAPGASAPPADDERARILAALEACAGNQTRAARMLGMSRTTFVQRLIYHDLPRPRPRPRG
jgi:DNA-binding NtrC family response regulator